MKKYIIFTKRLFFNKKFSEIIIFKILAVISFAITILFFACLPKNNALHFLFTLLSSFFIVIYLIKDKRKERKFLAEESKLAEQQLIMAKKEHVAAKINFYKKCWKESFEIMHAQIIEEINEAVHCHNKQSLERIHYAITQVYENPPKGISILNLGEHHAMIEKLLEETIYDAMNDIPPKKGVKTKEQQAVYN